jgi:hypothetical protein
MTANTERPSSSDSTGPVVYCQTWQVEARSHCRAALTGDEATHIMQIALEVRSAVLVGEQA